MAALDGVEVTVLLPAKNESADIGAAIESILDQDFDLHRVEVLVVDGGSVDGTAEVAREALRHGQLASVNVVSNPVGTTPSNLNRGLSEASGRILCRVDARSRIPRSYLRRCVELLDEDSRRGVVGGSQIAAARSQSSLDRGIARALNNRWGMGLSRYRRSARSGPADTVYLGAFRTDDLRAIGGWDESFESNQDFELNRRMGRSSVVWFDGGLRVGYLPRRSIRGLFEQYRRFGRWKATYWRRTGDTPRPRQLLLLAGPVVIVPCFTIAFRRRPGVSVVGAVVGAAAVDHFGSGKAPARPAERVVALAALATTSLGWTLGVWESWILRR
jgi:glycosyltransferase involved in cell wall biosynthesis